MATINLFNRFSGSHVNLDGRTAEVDPGGTTDTYSLHLGISLPTIEVNGSTVVRVTALKNGQSMVSQEIFFFTTNSSIGDIPDSALTASNGQIVFEIIGDEVGTTTLSASMVVEGVTYESNEQELTVIEFDPPENYDATGYGRVTLVVESTFANATVAQVKRLSHIEQQRKFPADTGLRLATFYETAEIAWIPKELLK